MSADTVKPPPNAPLNWVCVECGEVKQKHSGQRFWCKPMELLERVSKNVSIHVPDALPGPRSEAWERFR